MGIGVGIVGGGRLTDFRCGEDGGKGDRRQFLTYAPGDLLQEWFLNDARGLEQGWTIQARPSGAADGSISLALPVRGGLRPDVSVGAVRFLDPAGNAVVTHSGLKAWDADGRVLPSKFVDAPSGFAVEVDERGARYPIVIDPLAQQAYFKAPNTEANDRFGWSAAVSGDTVAISGETIVTEAWTEDSDVNTVNGDQNDNNATNSGAAYVFERIGGQWRQAAYLKVHNSEMDDRFGFSLAVAGNRAADTETMDLFGHSVAMSGDLLVAGAPEENSGSTGVNGDPGITTFASNSGARYIFTGMAPVCQSLAKVGESAPGAPDIAFSSPGMAAVSDVNNRVILETALVGIVRDVLQLPCRDSERI